MVGLTNGLVWCPEEKKFKTFKFEGGKTLTFDK